MQVYNPLSLAGTRVKKGTPTYTRVKTLQKLRKLHTTGMKINHPSNRGKPVVVWYSPPEVFVQSFHTPRIG